MPSIVVDAGPLVALFDRSETRHTDVVDFVKRTKGPFVTNIAVLTEVVALLDFSPKLQLEFLAWAANALEIDGITPADLPRIIEIMSKYHDLPTDFADASLLALCERRGITAVASLDKDFDIYRTADRKRLNNVFLA